MAIHCMCLRCCKMVWAALVITGAAAVIPEKDRMDEVCYTHQTTRHRIFCRPVRSGPHQVSHKPYPGERLDPHQSRRHRSCVRPSSRRERPSEGERLWGSLVQRGLNRQPRRASQASRASRTARVRSACL
jgi:hypothetical protein